MSEIYPSFSTNGRFGHHEVRVQLDGRCFHGPSSLAKMAVVFYWLCISKFSCYSLHLHFGCQFDSCMRIPLSNLSAFDCCDP